MLAGSNLLRLKQQMAMKVKKVKLSCGEHFKNITINCQFTNHTVSSKYKNFIRISSPSLLTSL